MKLLSGSLFLLSGALAASASLQEEPPVACLESGACYQVLPFVRYLKVVIHRKRPNWIKLDKSTIMVIKGFLAGHKWWKPVCLLPGRSICPTTSGKSQVVICPYTHMLICHMPNHRWEISGGDDKYYEVSHKVIKFIWNLLTTMMPMSLIYGVWSGRFVAPQPLVRGEGLFDVSSESVVTCPQVSQFFRWRLKRQLSDNVVGCWIPPNWLNTKSIKTG